MKEQQTGHSYIIHNLYSLLNIIRVIKSRRVEVIRKYSIYERDKKYA
jgi:tRNA1(Val) A37 N6-methylase TrmN6